MVMSLNARTFLQVKINHVDSDQTASRKAD